MMVCAGGAYYAREFTGKSIEHTGGEARTSASR
jgi:hypothetical protein